MNEMILFRRILCTPLPWRSLLGCLLLGNILLRIVPPCAASPPPYYGYQFGSSGNDYSASICTDSVGNSFLTGNTNGSLFGPSVGAQDIFVSKHHSSNGSVMWGVKLGSPLPDSGVAVATLPSSSSSTEDIFVTGYTTGKLFDINPNSTLWHVKFSGGVTEKFTLCPGDRFIATPCSYYWGTWSGAVSLYLKDSKDSVIKDSHSLDYACGILRYDFQGEQCSSFSLSFGCFLLSKKCSATVALVVFHNSSAFQETLVDGFVARYNSLDGKKLWGIQFGNPNFLDVPNAIAVSPYDGHVYIVESQYFAYNPGIVILKFNSSNGKIVWDYSYRETVWQSYYGTSISCDLIGFIYVLGYIFSNSISPSPSLLLLKLFSNGTLDWKKEFGGKYDIGSAVAVDNDSALYITGYERYGSTFLYKLDVNTGDKIWKRKENSKVPWSLTLLNSSIYVSSTILREHKNKYHLSRYDSGKGSKIWGINFALVPTGSIPTEYYHTAVSTTTPDKIRVAASVTNKGIPGVDCFILSPNICEPGNFSLNYSSPCEICPSNTFSKLASHKCTPCSHGFVSKPGSSTCTPCYGGYYTSGRSLCFFGAPESQYYLLFVLIPTGILILIIFLSNPTWTDFEYVFSISLASFDLLTDLLYVSTVFFYNRHLFYLYIVFLFLPGLIPVALKYVSCWRDLNMIPRPFQTPPSLLFCCPNYSVGWYIVRGIIILIWTVCIIPYTAIVVVIGYYFIQTKLIFHPIVETIWYRLCFIEPDEVPEVDSPMMKYSENLRYWNTILLIEILIEGLPQLIIQLINNLLMKSFGLIPQLTVIAGILGMFNSCYRILYFRVHNIPLSEIPISTPLSYVHTAKSIWMKAQKLLDTSWKCCCVNDESSDILLLDDNHVHQGNDEPITIHFTSGYTGLVYAIENFNECYRPRLSVFRIAAESPYYPSRLRKGWTVESINGISYNESANSPTSNYCLEECDITFLPPIPHWLTVRVQLPHKIMGFEDIGITVVHHQSIHFDVAYYEVLSVMEHSICYHSGVQVGDRIMSVNSRSTFAEIKHELFLHPPPSLLPSQFWNPLGKEDICRSVTIEFKRSLSGWWWDEWVWDQEILNNHLRAIGLSIVTSKKGIPHILNQIPLAPTANLDSFASLLLYIIGCSCLICLQLFWIGVWVVVKIFALFYMLFIFCFYRRGPCRCVVSIADFLYLILLLFLLLQIHILLGLLKLLHRPLSSNLFAICLTLQLLLYIVPQIGVLIFRYRPFLLAYLSYLLFFFFCSPILTLSSAATDAILSIALGGFVLLMCLARWRIDPIISLARWRGAGM